MPMSSTKQDRVLLRTKDISVILLICTILGILGTQFRKIYRWDEAADRVVALEVRIRQTENVNTAVVARLDEISKQLDQVNWQLRRMNGNGRNP